MNITLKLQAKVNGSGIPLLLVPGGLTGWKSWEPFEETFTGMGRKVIRVQLLNVQYGIEDRQLPSGYSVKTESHALEATLDSLGLTAPIDIIAWSFGAFISLDYALDHPDRIRTLTLIEPPAIWIIREEGELDTQTLQTMKLFETMHGEITDEMLAEFLQNVGFARPGESPRNLPQWEQWLPYKRSLRNNPAIVKHNDDLKRLKNLKSPVLLVKGTGSALFLHKILDGLASNLPDSRIIEMPGGHAPHLVSRETFLQEWDKFQRNP